MCLWKTFKGLDKLPGSQLCEIEEQRAGRFCYTAQALKDSASSRV